MADFNKSVVKLRQHYERLDRAKRRAILIEPIPFKRRKRYVKVQRKKT